MWVTGRHPVEDLLISTRQRPRKLLLSEAVPPAVRDALAARAGAARVPVATCSRDEWRRRTGEAEGGGIAAEIGEYLYASLPEWMETLAARAAAFLLDGITDPQNFGTILRNARAFGIAGVISPKDRSCPVTGAVFRSSAGAAAHVPVIQVTNLARAIDDLKEAGFWIFAAEAAGERTIGNLAPAARTAFVLGGEEKGIRRLVRAGCDGSVRIPIDEAVDSLNVAVASGILGFWWRAARDRDAGPPAPSAPRER